MRKERKGTVVLVCDARQANVGFSTEFFINKKNKKYQQWKKISEKLDI